MLLTLETIMPMSVAVRVNVVPCVKKTNIVVQGATFIHQGTKSFILQFFLHTYAMCSRERKFRSVFFVFFVDRRENKVSQVRLLIPSHRFASQGLHLQSLPNVFFLEYAFFELNIGTYSLLQSIPCPGLDEIKYRYSLFPLNYKLSLRCSFI